MEVYAGRPSGRTLSREAFPARNLVPGPLHPAAARPSRPDRPPRRRWEGESSDRGRTRGASEHGGSLAASLPPAPSRGNRAGSLAPGAQPPTPPLDRRVPSGLQVPGVLDNLRVHEGEPVQRWLRRHPRFVFRFVSTSSSWMNMVEGWWGHLQQPTLTRGSFPSVPGRVQAIEECAKVSNGAAHPWIWTQSTDGILRILRKIRQRLGWDPTVGAPSHGIVSPPSAAPHEGSSRPYALGSTPATVLIPCDPNRGTG